MNQKKANLTINDVSLGITGFSSPAETYIQSPLSLHELLITEPSAMSMYLSMDDDLAGKGIYTNDLLVVNKSLTPCTNDVVLCLLNGQLICRVINKQKNRLYKVTLDGCYIDELIINETDDFMVQGVVPFSVRVHADPGERIQNFVKEGKSFYEFEFSLDDVVNSNPIATFISRGNGHSMQGIGIFNGDLIFVDRALNPINGSVIVCNCDGEFACKILDARNLLLLSASEDHPPKSIKEFTTFSIEGVVAASIRLLRSVPVLL